MGKSLNEGVINTPDEKMKSDLYQNMYHSIIGDLTKVFELLDKKDKISGDFANDLLERIQCDVKEIFFNPHSIAKGDRFYSEIPERLNLQALGYSIKEESTINNVHRTTFTQRENAAEKELQDSLNDLLDEKTKDKVYSAILSNREVDYTNKVLRASISCLNLTDLGK